MSVELQKLRAEVLREALLKGWTHPNQVQGWPQVESTRIERWYRRLYSCPDAPLGVGGRLCNHFSIGADPEYVLMEGTVRADARHLNLKAGPAFGADNNGRLVELRPEPSRSALSVLASLWLAMRWMGVFHPDVFRYSWRSGAYAVGDGLGGHIHFGRKRTALRVREVANLDRITHLLYTANVYSREEGRSRVQKSQGGHYGHLGDIRTQPHGWEYRTLPSWIDSPWLAYLSLVLGKLVVAFPEYVPGLSEGDGGLNSEQARAQIRLLLAYFSPLDDDARLAFTILSKRGFPSHAQGLDFKSNWGIFVGGPFGTAKEAIRPDVYPKTIPPRPEEELELMFAMYEGRTPELNDLVPTWTPTTLPKGYKPLLNQVDTRVSPGLGEFAMDLCFYGSHKLNVMVHNTGQPYFRCGSEVEARIRACNFEQRTGCKIGFEGDHNLLYIPDSKGITSEALMRARRILVDSRAYPMWFNNEVHEGCYEEYLKPDLKKGPAVKKVFDTRI